ncbi:MAG: protein kinase [Bryobacterales bacterium]|nr:protein kinase [Bryobacterales bacterium]
MTAGERESFLRRETAGDAALLAVVQDLLNDLSEETLEDTAIEEDSRVGRRIGRYEITAKLGSGGMGQVYAARDVELGRMVALKFLEAGARGAHGPAERLIREAKAASALNHTHIVTIFDVVRTDTDVALAMELVEGQSLREKCRSPQPVEQVIRWGREIAQALAATHARGIVHRDIKPENIMVRLDGHSKVVDFGLARSTPLAGANSLASASSFIGVMAGTLKYMSPEQTQGNAPVAASDIFSLGAVLFELLCGRGPFDAATPLDTAHAIAHAEPADPEMFRPEIPLALSAVLLSMLAKDPAERPTALQVDQRLAAISVGARESRPASRVPLAAGIIASIAALAIAGALWWTPGRGAAGPQPLKLVPIANMPESRVTAAAVSPDGSMLAYAPADGPISIRRLRDAETNSIRSPKGLRASRIAWFADQRHLLVSGIAEPENQAVVWLVPIDAAGGPPKLLSKGRDAAPSPDGAHIALVSADGGLIWVIQRDGTGQRAVRAGGANTTYSSVVWSPDSRRISYMMSQSSAASSSTDAALTFQTADRDTGQVVAHVDNLAMYAGTALPDGRILCLPWAYPASSHGGKLMEIRTDPKTGAYLGHSSRPMPYMWDGLYTSFSTSQDGKVMALLAATAYVNLSVAELKWTPTGSVSITKIKRLTDVRAEDYPHSWTRDGRTVLFESNRNGDSYHLFRIGLDAREAEPLAPRTAPAVWPHTTPDGRWILYRRQAPNRNAELMRMPVEGGKPERIAVSNNIPQEFRCGLAANTRCVVRSTEGDQYVYRELDPLRGPGRVLSRTTVTPQLFLDWDLSPDGKTVAIPNHDSRTAQVRLLSLDAESGADERLLRMEGLRNLSSVAWPADGRGLFVSATTPTGGVLVYSDLAGATRKLLESDKATFVVPSPDGKRFVFPERIRTSSLQWLQAP